MYHVYQTHNDEPFSVYCHEFIIKNNGNLLSTSNKYKIKLTNRHLNDTIPVNNANNYTSITPIRGNEITNFSFTQHSRTVMSVTICSERWRILYIYLFLHLD